MEFRNRTIFNGVPELQSFADRELPMKLAYAVGKSLRRLSDAFEFIMEQRNKVINRYAKRDDDNNSIPAPNGGIKFEDGEAVETELEGLFDKVTDIAIYSIPMDDFGDKFKPTSAECAALLRFGILEDGEEE